MRTEYGAEVEKGRVRDGVFKTATGDKHGAFFLRCPTTGERLTLIVADGETTWKRESMDGEPWDHVSVSCERRCPTWQEMCWVKEIFFADDELVVQYHPAKSDYVNEHPFVLHLWRPLVSPIPMPPKKCV